MRADCENLAKTAPDERAKALLSDMAAKWEKLASLVERNRNWTERILPPLRRSAGSAQRAGLLGTGKHQFTDGRGSAECESCAVRGGHAREQIAT
jgi:hypothetical protein